MENVKKHVFASLLFVFIGISFAQAQRNLQLISGSTFRVNGTSSLHDWDMSSRSGTGRITIHINENQISNIQNLVVDLPAESLKSGKNGLDRNAYKALNTNQHKNIRFELTSAQKQNEHWNLRGTLLIAGVRRNVTIRAKETFNGNELILEGSHSFNLTDHNITPPTALMGTVRTADPVSIHFRTVFR